MGKDAVERGLFSTKAHGDDFSFVREASAVPSSISLPTPIAMKDRHETTNKNFRAQSATNSFRMPTPLFFLPLLPFMFLGRTEAAVAYLGHGCSYIDTFTLNTTYQFNRDALFSDLSSNARRKNGFYNTSVGRDSADTVYGLFQCWRNFTADICQRCATDAGVVLAQKHCPTTKAGVIWYDECILRFSNQYISSVVAEKPAYALTNPDDINVNASSFNQLVIETLNSLASRAANRSSDGKLIATREVVFAAPNRTLYTFAQCTGDLSPTDCQVCLLDVVKIIPQCCSGKKGGRALFPSCGVRYEIYSFYGNSTAAPEITPPAYPPAASPPPADISLPAPSGEGRVSRTTIIAVVSPIVMLFIFGFIYILSRRWKKQPRSVLKEDNVDDEIPAEESLQYDFSTIDEATDKFSKEKKLGEGGFGAVYRGRLPDGQEIAVKRLSKGSAQGVQEFKNEVVLMAKLQHRNLARLLGFCLEGGEKILVYEYVPNKSLDYFLYDPEKKAELDWSRRYKIIVRVARAILYLHEESQLKIIHRDLKASNILLDGHMNPKISDFGMARIFEVDQTQENTNRVVGTYGYMSPEYAMQGIFSVKSDVYSFGVIILEIISGKRNRTLCHSDCAEDLLSHTWKLWKDGVPLELVDETLRGFYSRDEALRCIHIGLLCVQEDPADRPTMASLVLMLNSCTVTLPSPEYPAYFTHSKDQSIVMKLTESGQSTSRSGPLTANTISITELVPR